MLRGCAKKCVRSVLNECARQQQFEIPFSPQRVMYKLPVSSRGQIKSRSVDKLFFSVNKNENCSHMQKYNKVKHQNNMAFLNKITWTHISVKSLFPKHFPAKCLFVLS